MKLQWLRPFIVLLAAAIVCISNIVNRKEIIPSLVSLLVTIIIFMIIGSIVTSIIDKTINSHPKETTEPEEISFEDNSEEDMVTDESAS